MHSDKFANPLHPATKLHKALTGKRKKTDDDHEAIAKSEFFGGCYHDPAQGFYVPGQNFDASFLGGAKLQKMVKSSTFDHFSPSSCIELTFSLNLFHDKTFFLFDAHPIKIHTF